MRVIPRSAIEIGQVSVSHAFSWGDRALLDGGYTIVPGRQLLQESVPMQSSPFLRTNDVVADSGRDNVAPIDFNGGSWECSVDKQGATVDTVRGNEASGDVEVVRSDDT